MAVKDLVIQRQAVGCLHHTQHDLASNHTLLGHAKVADIVDLIRQPSGTDCGHVVEHDGQVPIHQGPQQSGQYLVDVLAVFYQRVHRTQQVLMFDGFGHHTRQRHGLDPTQDAELGVRIAQAIEDHHSNQRFHVDGVTGATKEPAQTIEAQ